jgi:hypothetical protein
MKTKNLIRLGIMLFALITFGIAGCKKDKNKDNSVDSASMQQLVNDETSFNNADNDALNDANEVLSKSGTKSTLWIPCNATLDSSAVVSDSITYYITYNGLNCSGNRLRTGQIEVKKNVNDHWSTAETKVYVKLVNLTVTKVSNQKTMTLNGTKIYENVSGGLVSQLGNGVTTVVHKVTGSVTATFDDNTTKTWNIARQRTFTGTPTDLVMTVDGFGSADGYGNLVVWGTNRHGEAFYTQIISSVVHRQACGWDPCSGVKIHQIPGDGKKATVTFGYDANNQPITGTNCPTNCKIDWEKNGQTGTLYIQI